MRHVLGFLVLGLLVSCAPAVRHSSEVRFELRSEGGLGSALGAQRSASKASNSASLGLVSGQCYAVHITAPDPLGSDLNRDQQSNPDSFTLPGCVAPKRMGRLAGAFPHGATTELRDVPTGPSRRFDIIGFDKNLVDGDCTKTLVFGEPGEEGRADIFYGGQRLPENFPLMIHATGTADLKPGLNVVMMDRTPGPGGVGVASYGDCDPAQGVIPQWHLDSPDAYTGLTESPLLIECSRFVDRFEIFGVAGAARLDAACVDGYARTPVAPLFNLDDIMNGGVFNPELSLVIRGFKGASTTAVFSKSLNLMYSPAYRPLSVNDDSYQSLELPRQAISSRSRIVGLGGADGSSPALFVEDSFSTTSFLLRADLEKGEHQWQAEPLDTFSFGESHLFFLRDVVNKILSFAKNDNFGSLNWVGSGAPTLANESSLQATKTGFVEAGSAALVATYDGADTYLKFFPHGVNGGSHAHDITADHSYTELQLLPWQQGYMALARSTNAGKNLEIVYYSSPDGTSWTVQDWSSLFTLEADAAVLVPLLAPLSEIDGVNTCVSTMLLVRADDGVVKRNFLRNPASVTAGCDPMTADDAADSYSPIMDVPNIYALAAIKVDVGDGAERMDLLLGGKDDIAWLDEDENLVISARSILYRSSDLGSTWSRVYIGGIDSVAIEHIAVVPMRSTSNKRKVDAFAALESKSVMSPPMFVPWDNLSHDNNSYCSGFGNPPVEDPGNCSDMDVGSQMEDNMQVLMQDAWNGF
jgi:hypothetical protein